MSADNLALWDALKTTDPAYVRKVPRPGGRQESTPNPQYQLQRMTEQCGPVGVGWGYTVSGMFTGDLGQPDTNPCFVAEVTVWLRDRANVYGPIVGLNQMYQRTKSGPMFDEDAPKKAITDALTKALSHAGMSADIYMGMYDDAAYVSGLKQQHQAPAHTAPPRQEQPGPRRVELPTAEGRQGFWHRRSLAVQIPYKPDGTSTDWSTWAERVSKCVQQAPSPALLERLLQDNDAGLDRLRKADPQTHNLLTYTVVAARNNFVPTGDE